MFRFFLALFFLIATAASAQDKIILINGKVLEVKSVELKDNKISFQSLNRSRQKRINPERVFSVQYADGSEKIIFVTDPFDPNDFKPEEMRMFIKGEQDADKHYHADGHRVVSAALGAGAGLLTIYGLVVPALYSTIAGSFSPSVHSIKASDPSLLNDLNFQEGYLKKCREKKIRNALIYGFGGFALGFTFYTFDQSNEVIAISIGYLITTAAYTILWRDKE